ncbi:MAG: glucose-1-phosphate cytidylyltransferase [Burkholderiaceae bacterium]
MQAMILAGGFGTRISEESTVRPKPMVEIGGRPVLWHIMKSYASHGINDFVICCGYKGHMIKEYFASYALGMSDVTVDLRNNSVTMHQTEAEPWTVTLVETGLNTMTGGRMKRAAKYLNSNEPFCCTYGDGVTNANIGEAIEMHKREGRLSTVTAVQPPGRFGAFTLPADKTLVPSFQEKPKGDGAWINGGYFVLDPQVIDYIEGDATIWEREPMERLAGEGQMTAYRHTGFWQPMDTLRDKQVLEELWAENKAPWKSWQD